MRSARRTQLSALEAPTPGSNLARLQYILREAIAKDEITKEEQRQAKHAEEDTNAARKIFFPSRVDEESYGLRPVHEIARTAILFQNLSEQRPDDVDDILSRITEPVSDVKVGSRRITLDRTQSDEIQRTQCTSDIEYAIHQVDVIKKDYNHALQQLRGLDLAIGNGLMLLITSGTHWHIALSLRGILTS